MPPRWRHAGATSNHAPPAPASDGERLSHFRRQRASAARRSRRVSRSGGRGARGALSRRWSSAPSRLAAPCSCHASAGRRRGARCSATRRGRRAAKPNHHCPSEPQPAPVARGLHLNVIRLAPRSQLVMQMPEGHHEHLSLVTLRGWMERHQFDIGGVLRPADAADEGSGDDEAEVRPPPDLALLAARRETVRVELKKEASRMLREIENHNGPGRLEGRSTRSKGSVDCKVQPTSRPWSAAACVSNPRSCPCPAETHALMRAARPNPSPQPPASGRTLCERPTAACLRPCGSRCK